MSSTSNLSPPVRAASSSRRSAWHYPPSALVLALTLLAAMLGFYLQVLHDAVTRAATTQAQMLQHVVMIPPDFVECDLPRPASRLPRHGCPPPPDRGVRALDAVYRTR